MCVCCRAQRPVDEAPDASRRCRAPRRGCRPRLLVERANRVRADGAVSARAAGPRVGKSAGDPGPTRKSCWLLPLGGFRDNTPVIVSPASSSTVHNACPKPASAGRSSPMLRSGGRALEEIDGGPARFQQLPAHLEQRNRFPRHDWGNPSEPKRKFHPCPVPVPGMGTPRDRGFRAIPAAGNVGRGNVGLMRVTGVSMLPDSSTDSPPAIAQTNR